MATDDLRRPLVEEQDSNFLYMIKLYRQKKASEAGGDGEGGEGAVIDSDGVLYRPPTRPTSKSGLVQKHGPTIMIIIGITVILLLIAIVVGLFYDTKEKFMNAKMENEWKILEEKLEKQKRSLDSADHSRVEYMSVYNDIGESVENIKTQNASFDDETEKYYQRIPKILSLGVPYSDIV